MKIINSGYSDQDHIFQKSDGCYLIDSNGDKYFDFVMGAGVHLFGHCSSEISRAIKEQVSQGTLYLQNNNIIRDFSENLCKLLSSDMRNLVFCNSGSEATQRAIRIARSYNNKNKIAVFEGGWHGINEWTLVSSKSRFYNLASDIPSGIPKNIYDDVCLIPYNCNETWSELEKVKDGLSCIIIEPLQGSNPQPNIKKFLKKLSEFCIKNEIILIFDEMITGFRLCDGGADKLFGIKADIQTFGKIIGGGLPIGIVAISNEINKKTYENEDKVMLTGGTFSGNPLIASAGNAVLKLLDKDMYNDLEVFSEKFKSELNSKIKKENLPFLFEGYKSFNRLYFTDKFVRNRKERDANELSIELQKKFRRQLFMNKVIWPNNGIVCLSLSQNPDAFSKIEVIVSSLKYIHEQ